MTQLVEMAKTSLISHIGNDNVHTRHSKHPVAKEQANEQATVQTTGTANGTPHDRCCKEENSKEINNDPNRVTQLINKDLQRKLSTPDCSPSSSERRSLPCLIDQSKLPRERSTSQSLRASPYSKKVVKSRKKRVTDWNSENRDPNHNNHAPAPVHLVLLLEKMDEQGSMVSSFQNWLREHTAAPSHATWNAIDTISFHLPPSHSVDCVLSMPSDRGERDNVFSSIDSNLSIGEVSTVISPSNIAWPPPHCGTGNLHLNYERKSEAPRNKYALRF